MGQQTKISKHKTRIFKDAEGFTNVKYWNTIVFRTKDNMAILNSGGWFTVTTKTRINQALHQFGFYGVSLFQKKHEWFIYNNSRVDAFGEGITVYK